MLHNERYTDQLGRSWLPKDGDANVGWTDEGAQQDGGVGSPNSILFQWHLPDLFQQNGFAFRLKENLRLPKVSEFPGGFPSTDEPLSTA
jgi:hypothetical protein